MASKCKPIFYSNFQTCVECKFFLKYVKRFTMMDTEVQKLHMQQISAFLVRGRQSHICITK